MTWLPDGRKSFKISLAILVQYRRVTDSQPPSQPRRRSKYAPCNALSASRSKNGLKMHSIDGKQQNPISICLKNSSDQVEVG